MKGMSGWRLNRSSTVLFGRDLASCKAGALQWNSLSQYDVSPD